VHSKSGIFFLNIWNNLHVARPTFICRQLRFRRRSHSVYPHWNQCAVLNMQKASLRLCVEADEVCK